MSGLDAPVSPCLQLRLRRFPPSLPSPSVSSSLPAPTSSASTSGSDCPPPARLTRGQDRRLMLELDCQCKLPYTVLHRISRIKTVACRGLRPCPLCHLCPATATACAVAASGPKQHRPSDERPLQRWCGHQRHNPPEGSCRGYINLFFGRSRADARPLSWPLMFCGHHSESLDFQHQEASPEFITITLKTKLHNTEIFFNWFSLVIDIHLFMSIIFTNFTYPFRDAGGLILTNSSRYETDKIQTFRPCLALRQQDWPDVL